MYCKLSFLLIIFWSRNSESSSIFEWLGWGDKKSPNLTYKGVPLIQVPFEELTPEDKFLVEASKIAGFELTELDACQHRLVMKLKSSCGSLSEEELAKFSVNLLNCQSAVEGRKEFPCEDNMSLKECTKDMDAEMWNAYLIISNRARAVCYASRQQLFRALSEMTVNKLMSTTHSHIEALTSLQKESSSIKSGTSLTLQEIERSQMDVLNRQRALASISIIVGEEIKQALTGATNQKQLLVDFRKDLENLLAKLQSKLDNAEKQVIDSAGSVKSSHTDLMNDMKEISKAATQILKKIDDSSKKVLENNDMTLEQFKEALTNMKEINLSIGYILSVVETVKQRSSLISDLVGEKGERLELVFTLFFHCLCLTAAMVVASFLTIPWTSRAFLLLSSSLNTYSNVLSLTEKNANYPKVDLAYFYCSFVAIALCDWTIRLIVKLLSDRRSEVTNKREENKTRSVYNNTFPNKNEVNSTNDMYSRSPLFNKFRSNLDETPLSNNKVNNWLTRNRYREEYPQETPNLNGYIKDSHIDDEIQSRMSSIPHSISGRSIDGRSICTAVSKHTGQRCRKKALKSSTYCNIHDR